jgi:hypothetical protein
VLFIRSNLPVIIQRLRCFSSSISGTGSSTSASASASGENRDVSALGSDIRLPPNQLRSENEHDASSFSLSNANETFASLQHSASTTTKTATRSLLFDGLLSKIDSMETTDTRDATPSPIIDWDKDVMGETELEPTVTNASSAISTDDAVTDEATLKKIRDINETRQRDIEKRIRKCQKFRMKQYSAYSTTEQAIEAAKAYAEQTNVSTLQEIQHWIPYTEQDVQEFFRQTFSKTPINIKEMKRMVEQYEQAIYNTSIFVVPGTTQQPSTENPSASKSRQKKLSPAITNYPKSSLKLLTLLKGLHNSTNPVSNPTEASIIKFVLRRSANTKYITTSDETSNTTTLSRIVTTPMTDLTIMTSDFDEYMEHQKEGVDGNVLPMIVDWNNDDSATATSYEDNGILFRHETSDDTRPRLETTNNLLPTNANYVRSKYDVQSSTNENSNQQQQPEYYHQSYDEYVRMIHVLERTREFVFSTTMNVKSPKKTKNANIKYKEVPNKTCKLASHLAKHLPNIMFINMIVFFEDICKDRLTCDTDEHQKPIKSFTQIRLQNVIDKFYYHFIAPQVADYIFDNDFTEKNETGNILNSNTANEFSSADGPIYNYTSRHTTSVHGHKVFLSSLDYYKLIHDKFVTLLIDIQSILYHGSRIIVMDDNMVSSKVRKSLLDGQQVDHVDVDAIEDELGIRTGENVTRNGSDNDDTVKMDDMSTETKKGKLKYNKVTNEAVDKLDESSIRPIGFRKRQAPTEIEQVTHLAFEAISLESNLKQNYVSQQHHSSDGVENRNNTLLLTDNQPLLNGQSEHHLNGSSIAHHNLFASVKSSSTPYSRMVFIDNLPIDITTERLIEVYSRCGDIESVELYNQRPDLDPGKLPKAEVVKRRARQTKISLAASAWKRPKTPVYGILTFANEKGYQKGINESLRIFGMIIQRHPVRSTPSWRMNTLYIEDIPEGHPCIDLEYQLSYALEPDLFVCLNAGQNYTATVGSCEIKFPTFELAYESHKKLQEKLEIFKSDADTNGSLTASTTTLSSIESEDSDNNTPTKTCRINWIEPQKDAHKWWTRQYGFD